MSDIASAMRDLRVSINRHQRCVLSLFTGAGGLDVGLEAAGFDVTACVELDADARKTLAANRPRWRLLEEGDIHAFTPTGLVGEAGLERGKLTLLAGGPPCQPFSKSAFWANGGARGLSDPRARTLRAYLKIVEAALPQVLLLENVNGLTTTDGESGLRLLQTGIRAINRRCGTRYDLQVFHINSVDYGIPQQRERVFLIANIDGKRLDLPPATHGVSGNLEPYRTAWDAIGDLDDPDWPRELAPTGKWAGLLKSIPEGKNYLWHTGRGGGKPLFGWRTRYWSFLLKLAKQHPSWTIQAEPGPATGPFHWRSRLLSIEELMRLQTFPSGYAIFGSRRSAHRQVGNAVPPALGELLGLEIRRQLLREQRVRRRLHLIPPRRDDCPDAHPTQPVPERYLALQGDHPDHPGIGHGPNGRKVVA